MISLAGNVLFFVALLAVAVACSALGLSVGTLFPEWSSVRACWLPFGIGFGAMTVAWGLVLRRWGLFRFLAALDHELLHVIAAILTGGKVLNMSVTSLGEGTVVVDRPNRVISVAPYWISLPLAAALVAASFAPAELFMPCAGVLGALSAYHLIRVATTCSPAQPDFRQTTYPVGLMAVVLANLVLAGLVASVATLQFDGGAFYIETLVEGVLSIPTLAGITRT